MRSIKEITLLLAKFLNKHKIKYTFVGAFAVSVYGEPRTTRDLDIIILLNNEDIPTILKFLQKNSFEVSEYKLKEALKDKSHISVFDKKSEYIIDIKGIYSKFDELTIKRRKKIKFNGTTIFVASKEDTIVNKVVFNSEKDVNDAITIYLRQRNIDESYIIKMCKEMGVYNNYIKLKEKIKGVE